MKERKFKLSASGKLALIITMTLSPLSLSYGSHIVPVENTANSPTLSKHVNNSTVVNIVAPSASGLSHNQYKEFNVNQQGITFNNLTYEAELNSNPNLINGRPATLILNEVVGVNISELQGRQQLAGSPADYILANRNGINCDGCSFDPQFNQVSLAVGEAIVNQGKFEKINTVDGKGSLNINASGAYWGFGKTLILLLLILTQIETYQSMVTLTLF
ncbi:filamentous hemagglutinin N-terminal domain-containing protein [Yersinia ruckeri]|uniref:two-partner secretion domain-containing protein n=1 Tax=Yersinia ruckeri TaxID=29486 RepID=UPI002264C4C5|nr:filamentous hemagglutinin N-terminal domain-containing protein [Yersinia ruckeri]UZX73107.1 filamentous hemagglutinin N-terminal domain-containing protein [Yersinia ruckeri]